MNAIPSRKRHVRILVSGPSDVVGMRAMCRADRPLDDCRSGPQLPVDGRLRRLQGDAGESCCRCSEPRHMAVALGLCRAAVASASASRQRALRSSGPDPRRESDAARATRDDADRDRRARGAHRRSHRSSRASAETTVLRVLESKAAAGEVAIAVTSAAMRVCAAPRFPTPFHRAIVPRCPCGRSDGADGRCSARLHRQGHSRDPLF